MASYSTRSASATASRYVVGRLVEVIGLEQRDHAGRGGVEERIRGLARRHAAREIAQVLLQRLERLGADLADAARPAVLGRGAELRELLEQARKLHQVLPGLARRVAGEAGEAVRDVGGVADLAHLAVADHVDAGRDLLLHDCLDGIGDDRAAAGGVVRDLAVLAREQHIGDRLRARQAADMRGENALGAGPHQPAQRNVLLEV